MHRRAFGGAVGAAWVAAATGGAMGSLTAPRSAQAQQQSNTLRLWRDGDAGERMNLRGRVVDGAGKPVAGAQVNVRQADGSAVYSEQYQGSLQTAADGGYRIATAVPGQYTGNKHIHMTVEHPDYWPVHTTVVFKGDNDDDPSAVPLEESRLNGILVWQGRFDVQMEKR